MEFYTENRPWGSFKQFIKNEKSTVKILFVNPNERLSLQYHNHRKEFWRVIAGDPQIQIGDKIITTKIGDEFEIPEKTNHRIIGGKEKAEILEISFGEFDENDIVRLEDQYGRPVRQ